MDEAEAAYDRSRENTRQDNQEYCPVCLLDSYWCRCEFDEGGEPLVSYDLEQRKADLDKLKRWRGSR